MGEIKKVLHVTNMWPDDNKPYFGAFVKAQIKSLQKLGVDIDIIHGRNYLKLRKNVRRYIKVNKPSIVHAHFGYTAAVLADICVFANLPLVISYCGGDINGEKGSILRRVKSYLGIGASLFGGVFARKIIVKNDSMIKKLPRLLARKSFIVPNGIDVELFKPREKLAAKRAVGWGEKKIVLFGGRKEDPTKNITLAIQSVDMARCQGVDVELKIIGNVNHEDMPQYLNAADLVLLTSFKEGSPNFIKEALACNTHVVSVPVGDVPWMLDNVTGSYLCGYDSKEISSAIMKVLTEENNGDGRNRILENGLDDVRIARKINKLYSECVQTDIYA